MAMKPMCEAFQLADPKTDYKAAVKLGQYRIGAQALYLPGFPSAQYLPLTALTRAWVQKGTVSSKGSCGAQFPVFILRVQYGDGLFQNLTFDKQEQADRALGLVCAARPDLSAGSEG